MTERQRHLLDFIIEFIDQRGFSPSHDDMKDALGLASKSGINRLLSALEEQGLIRRLHNRARGVEVLHRPPSILDIYSPESLRKLTGAQLDTLILRAETAKALMARRRAA